MRSKELAFGDYVDDVVAEWAEVLDGKALDGRALIASTKRPLAARAWTIFRRGRAPYWRHGGADEFVPSAAERDEYVETFKPVRTDWNGSATPPSQKALAIIRESSCRLAECIATAPDELSRIEWRDLERVVATVCEALGFQTELGAGSKDGGVDVRLRHETGVYLLQIKHWVAGKQVGVESVRAFLSVVLREAPDVRGVVLSTSGFTRSAVESLTVIERRSLVLAERDSVVNLCRAYVRSGGGLFRLMPADEALVRSTTGTTLQTLAA